MCALPWVCGGGEAKRHRMLKQRRARIHRAAIGTDGSESRKTRCSDGDVQTSTEGPGRSDGRADGVLHHEEVEDVQPVFSLVKLRHERAVVPFVVEVVACLAV